jgi:hypothetical protein
MQDLIWFCLMFSITVTFSISKHNVDTNKVRFYTNVGKTLDTVRSELPSIFSSHNIDVSVLADRITVIHENKNKITMTKKLYATTIQSLQVACVFLSIYPCVNVKKIDYDEEMNMIQCLVDISLPDISDTKNRILWEGIFYFVLDDAGLIESHILDRKIPTSKIPQKNNSSELHWLKTQAN